MYQLLQDRVDDASFVACLERASEAKVGAKSPALEQVEREVLDEQHGDHEDRANASTGAEGLSEGWELVEKEEVIDAMASFIAAYIQVSPNLSLPLALTLGRPTLADTQSLSISLSLSLCPSSQAHPKASKLNPQELQKALGVAIKEIRKSKVVVLWEWSSAIWRLGAMSYGAFTMYTNPWLARAVLQAVWCCSRLAVGATATAVGLLV